MTAHLKDRSSSTPLKPIIVLGVMGFVLALRLAHLSSAMLSPLTYQPGPDEDYYLRFGQAVAAGQGQYSPEFTFMDPAYGYLLGAVFKLAGVSLFAVYALQCLLDTATAYGILIAGRLLGRPRAGLYGALLYGMASVAIMFCTTLLKEVWVTAFMTWWVVGALAIIRSERKLAWLAFGVYCGLGIALRSTLLLMALIALLLPGLGVNRSARKPLNWARKAALAACGAAVALLPWSLRNHHAYGGFSALPHNGGVVLHQLYNEKNPDSAIWIPDFVNYLEPSEIWRGYADEASKRERRSLSPPEVDHYWKAEALSFMQQHPGRVLEDAWHKTLKFFSATEIPINRSLVEESMFSPTLKWLPAPAPWLLALGIAGLAWLALEDRRWPIIAAPFLIALFTVAVFFAEDRFRFHAMAMLALCSGMWIDLMLRNVKDRPKRQVLVFGMMAGLIGTVSVALGRINPPAPIHWDHIVWGYIKMGKIAEARTLAERIASEQPRNGPILEALGFTAIARGQYSEAAQDYQRAIEIRPQSHVAHYNLAKVFLQLGDRSQAAAEAKIAVSLHPSADYQALLSQMQAPQ
jgi:4-amino-4-deoxy-L-arabinose transferase-like glycosyltransferase